MIQTTYLIIYSDYSIKDRINHYYYAFENYLENKVIHRTVVIDRFTIIPHQVLSRAHYYYNGTNLHCTICAFVVKWHDGDNPPHIPELFYMSQGMNIFKSIEYLQENGE